MRIRVIDEHHEAYICIEEAFREGLFHRPVTLVHVDSHGDLAPIAAAMSCYHPHYRRYVEKHLTIGNYIAPLILRGRVDRVLFVNARDTRWNRSSIGSIRGEGKSIRIGIAHDRRPFYPDFRTWLYRETTDIVGIGRAVGTCDAILDIDCDYFSCNHIPRKTFKTCPRRSADAYRIDLSRLQKCNFGEGMKRAIFNPSRRWIDICLDHFTRHLSIKPRLMIISKSAKSGFTPIHHADFIANRLAEGLQKPDEGIKLPLDEKFQPSDSLCKRACVWYSAITDELYGFDEHLAPLFRDIASGKRIGDVRKRLLREYHVTESSVDYHLLRLIFTLKRRFLIL